MTAPEPRLPVPEDDALDAAASAVVDGAATPEEAALVAASPEGPARLARLRAVADAVGQPVASQSRAAAAGALAAALAAFDAPDAVGTAAALGTVASPAGLPAPARPGAAPAGRPAGEGPSVGATPWRPRLAAVAAAVVLLLGVGAVAVGVRRGNTSDTLTARSAETPARPAGGAGTSPGPPQAGAAVGPARAAAPALTPPSGPVPAAPGAAMAASPPVVDGGDVGTQSDPAALAQRAAAALDSTPDAATTATAAALPRDVQACVAAGPSRAAQPVGNLRYRATGRYQGTPAVIVAYDRPSSPPRLLLVLAGSDCSVLASTPF